MARDRLSWETRDKLRRGQDKDGRDKEEADKMKGRNMKKGYTKQPCERARLWEIFQETFAGEGTKKRKRKTPERSWRWKEYIVQEHH